MNSGEISNLVQGKGKGKNIAYAEETQSENISTKRKNDENIKSTITATLQELKGLSGQALLRKILENKSYTLYDDNKYVYCQSCQKPITLHRSNDGARLKEHTDNHNASVIDNDFIDLTESVDDNEEVSQINQNQKPSEVTSKDSKKYVKVFYLVYLAIEIIVSEYNIFVKYGTFIINQKIKVQYIIFRNDDLYDELNHVGGYFKSIKCLEYYSKKWCYNCDLLAKNEAFNKRNQEYQELVAQIDCVMILCVNKELPDLIHHKYSQIPNFNK
ncbi:5261_t:CDS:2 [Funneliformis caledonium]|uniref:5261_t:CDS:1 n=1 Tax=Funneliformis caledonium TaxID=1117310 RepID=A0A9N9G2R2_9GLOM|nr:5261_t:CDS:2 [Funneliformis caledonium]